MRLLEYQKQFFIYQTLQAKHINKYQTFLGISLNLHVILPILRCMPSLRLTWFLSAKFISFLSVFYCMFFYLVKFKKILISRMADTKTQTITARLTICHRNEHWHKSELDMKFSEKKVKHFLDDVFETFCVEIQFVIVVI